MQVGGGRQGHGKSVKGVKEICRKGEGGEWRVDVPRATSRAGISIHTGEPGAGGDQVVQVSDIVDFLSVYVRRMVSEKVPVGVL